jgi:hypothetical protein
LGFETREGSDIAFGVVPKKRAKEQSKIPRITDVDIHMRGPACRRLPTIWWMNCTCSSLGSGKRLFSERVNTRFALTSATPYPSGVVGVNYTRERATAQLALEEAERSGNTVFAVLGCGVIGLTTARLFQRRGFTVTIYTKDTPPNTTSNIAGGWWAPVTLFEPGRQGSAFE